MICTVLLLAAPVAPPRTPGVKDLHSLRLQREHVGCVGRLGQHHGVAVVHVLSPLREHLPQQAPAAAPSPLRRVQHRLVHGGDEGVPLRRVRFAGLRQRHAELPEHHRHPKLGVRVVGVALDPSRRELGVVVRRRFRQPSFRPPTGCNRFTAAIEIHSEGGSPGIWVEMGRGVVDAQSLVVPDEVSSYLACNRVRVKPRSLRRGGPVEAFCSGSQEVHRIDRLHVKRHLLNPLLRGCTRRAGYKYHASSGYVHGSKKKSTSPAACLRMGRRGIEARSSTPTQRWSGLLCT
ncbi:hypothetical protein GW17_00022632 [Ensete ventricosum]|nr:hypothetical protein GW17_00022632 [Ensete ventricosum]RZS14116.1 hypothetical protein BHM03_00045779 [Ensete ventricosum]